MCTWSLNIFYKSLFRLGLNPWRDEQLIAPLAILFHSNSTQCSQALPYSESLQLSPPVLLSALGDTQNRSNYTPSVWRQGFCLRIFFSKGCKTSPISLGILIQRFQILLSRSLFSEKWLSFLPLFQRRMLIPYIVLCMFITGWSPYSLFSRLPISINDNTIYLSFFFFKWL